MLLNENYHTRYRKDHLADLRSKSNARYARQQAAKGKQVDTTLFRRYANRSDAEIVRMVQPFQSRSEWERGNQGCYRHVMYRRRHLIGACTTNVLRHVST